MTKQPETPEEILKDILIRILRIVRWLLILTEIIVKRVGALYAFAFIWAQIGIVLQSEIGSSTFTATLHHFSGTGLAVFTIFMTLKDIIFDSVLLDSEGGPPRPPRPPIIQRLAILFEKESS
jgi:hypothetical protein